MLSTMKYTMMDLFVIFFDKMEKTKGVPKQIVASLVITTLYLEVTTIRLVVIVSGPTLQGTRM